MMLALIKGAALAPPPVVPPAVSHLCVRCTPSAQLCRALKGPAQKQPQASGRLLSVVLLVCCCADLCHQATVSCASQRNGWVLLAWCLAARSVLLPFCCVLRQTVSVYEWSDGNRCWHQAQRSAMPQTCSSLARACAPLSVIILNSIACCHRLLAMLLHRNPAPPPLPPTCRQRCCWSHLLIPLAARLTCAQAIFMALISSSHPGQPAGQ